MPDPLPPPPRAPPRRARDDMRAAIDGLPPDALNWRPAGDDTNSIAAMANHAVTSARTWLSVAVDAPLPDRDRPTEFQFEAASATELLAFVDGLFEECLSLIDSSRTVDWAAMRHHWDPGRDIELFPAWALPHAA